MIETISSIVKSAVRMAFISSVTQVSTASQDFCRILYPLWLKEMFKEISGNICYVSLLFTPYLFSSSKPLIKFLCFRWDACVWKKAVFLSASFNQLILDHWCQNVFSFSNSALSWSILFRSSRSPSSVGLLMDKVYKSLVNIFISHVMDKAYLSRVRTLSQWIQLFFWVHESNY